MTFRLKSCGFSDRTSTESHDMIVDWLLNLHYICRGGNRSDTITREGSHYSETLSSQAEEYDCYDDGLWRTAPQAWNSDLVRFTDPVEAYETVIHIAHTADEAGFRSVWLIDQFQTIPRPSQEVAFEAWATTAALARYTRCVRVGQLVTCAGYRNPALLAKMASTVDVLSHGRLTFGIGAGWHEQEYRATIPNNCDASPENVSSKRYDNVLPIVCSLRFKE